MAITNIGYDGSVTEAQWAKLIPQSGGSNYGVSGITDFKVTAHASLALGVNIAPGSGWGHGVLTTSDTTVSLQGAAIASGTRWDMVVVRRNWAGAGGATSFAIISGSTAKALTTRNTNPGTLDDQPIALVQFTAGQTAATAIVDLRCWSRNGGILAKDALVLNYLTDVSTKVYIDNVEWTRALNASDVAEWRPGPTSGTATVSIFTNDTSRTAAVTFPVTYLQAPDVIVSLASNVAGAASRLLISAYSATTTGFTVKLQTNDNLQIGTGYTISVKWVAMPTAP